MKQILFSLLGSWTNSHILHTNLHVAIYWLNSALNSILYYCACTYSVWFSPRITGTEPWNCAVTGERLVSVLESFVSNCKWHSIVQIQSLIAAHKSTDRGEWSCVVLSEICYTEQYIANMLCLMATNYSVGAKLYSTFELRVHTNGGQMEYGFFNPPLLTSFFSYLFFFWTTISLCLQNYYIECHTSSSFLFNLSSLWFEF